MVDPLNYVLNKLSRNTRCCHKCIYCNFSFVDSLKSYSCDLRGFPIDEKEVDSKSCWRFARRKEGIPIERQKYDTIVNRIKRNWYYITMAICAILALIVTLLKTLGMI